MKEISHSSDRTNSQGGNSENRQNSDGLHRRLAGLYSGHENMLTGPMDLEARTSGSKNDVGRSGNEPEGVRKK